MLEKLKKVVVVLFALHLVAGAGVLVLLSLSPPWVVGAGRFAEIAGTVELFDFKWWVFGAAVFVWLWPVPPALLYLWARGARSEMARLRGMLTSALDQHIPIEVDIDERVPVHIDQPLEVPVAMSTKVGFDDEIEIDARIPIDAAIPIDSVIETSVLGLGTIKVPIRATIPLRLELPLKTHVHVRAQGIPIALSEKASVAMPAFAVPLKCRLVTTIDLLDNLRRAERLLPSKSA